MLDYNAKSTYQDPDGYSWDFYRDDQKGPNPDPNTFYIIPKPQFVFDNNKPSIQFHTYATDGADNGSGFCRFDVELSIPSKVEAAVKTQILGNSTRFPGVTNPNFQTLDLKAGSKAVVTFADGDDTIDYVAEASNYGGDTASFLMKLTASQMKNLKASFTTSGGALNIKYYLTVSARLQSVSAVLKFNSAEAYTYQVTQPTYNSWGDQTSPGSAEGFLKSSQSSHVELTWGIDNPSESLKKTVTDWANTTLATLVTAAVKKVIALQKITSSRSFKISEVESFTSNYSENMVVDWSIQPTATLPSFQDMGLSISDFEKTVNKRQQQMIVTANVPFDGHTISTSNSPSAGGTISQGLSNPVKIKSISVTVKYPTLSEAHSTYEFTKNESYIFLAPYDPTAGPEWSLEYKVNYVDSSVPAMSGSIKNITTVQQYLKLAQIGVLSVEFDATPAFNNNEMPKPDEVVVDFSFVNSKGGSFKNINQKLTFKKADQSYVQSVQSLQPLPITNGYNYKVTYNYNGVEYSAPLKSGETGFKQIIDAVNAVSSTNLIVFVKGEEAANDPILEVDVKMWFDNPSKTPDNVSNNPNKNSPAVFTITPSQQGTNIIGHETFIGVEIANSPLVYSASITAAEGQINIPPQKLMQNTASVFLSAKQRYFTLEVNLASIDWGTATYDAIQVIPKFSVKSDGTTKTFPAPDTGIQWNTSEVDSKYHTQGYQDGDTVTYDLEVVYITKGQNPVKKTLKNQTSPVFDVPATLS
ncbi:hypothetical protein [uncultured Psychroserpens sp.]|uniref:hypothetical protein n=1 Tax=uncultured Psychroserpens sp. TaxID=255436 RepID=UPI0026059E5D|nr:hypothetical protein [uncultured Psychroserpens sp.]